MRATVHRVLSPCGSSPRYSVPFFHHVGMNLNLPDHILPSESFAISHHRLWSRSEISSVPPEILTIRDGGEVPESDCTFFKLLLLCRSCVLLLLLPPAADLLDVYNREPVGNATLIVRVKWVDFLYPFAKLYWKSIRSHPDVAKKYYPDLFEALFPNGHTGF